MLLSIINYHFTIIDDIEVPKIGVPPNHPNHPKLIHFRIETDGFVDLPLKKTPIFDDH